MNRTTSGAIDTREVILIAGERLMARNGFSAVGLHELLLSAHVPKGSFYHYFSSKDAFGEALLERYFENYLAQLDETLSLTGLGIPERLMLYFQNWQETQSVSECQGKCLAVKLGAEVADLSESMRLVLRKGTDAIIARLAGAIHMASAEGSLSVHGDPARLAAGLYQLWLGASLLVKIARNTGPFETAMQTTRSILGMPR